MTLREAAEEFYTYLITRGRSSETITGYMKNLRYFNRYLCSLYNCETYLEDINTEHIENYLHYLLKEKGYSPSSRRRALAILRSFYNFCHKRGWCQANIAAGVEAIKSDKKERVFLTYEEIQAILEACEQPLMQLVIQFLYYTGLRISECLNLRLQDVDLESKIIRVIAGKGCKDRNIPISHKLMPLLTDYVEKGRIDRGTDYFFSTSSGSLSRSYVDREIRRAGQKAGLGKTVSAHIMRHSFASSLVQKEVNIFRVQKLLGHSSLNTTSIYIHANMQELQQAVDRL